LFGVSRQVHDIFSGYAPSHVRLLASTVESFS